MLLYCPTMITFFFFIPIQPTTRGVECVKMSQADNDQLDPTLPAPPSAISMPNASLEDQTLLLIARLMEGGQEDEDTCKDLDTLTSLLSDEENNKTTDARKPLFELLDADGVETILDCLDMRQAPAVRGHATLTISAYLKASEQKGVDYLSSFFTSRVGRGTYDDLILAFSVAASLFPVVPSVISRLFLSDGFISTLGPLMKRKWKSKKVEQATLEMLNAACMDSACREAIQKYCTEWLEEIVNEAYPRDTDNVMCSSPGGTVMVEPGSVQQRMHSELVKFLAAVILAKLQVSVLIPPLSSTISYLTSMSASILTDLRNKGCSSCTERCIRGTGTAGYDKYRRFIRHVQEHAINNSRSRATPLHRRPCIRLITTQSQGKLSFRWKISHQSNQNFRSSSTKITRHIWSSQCSGQPHSLSSDTLRRTKTNDTTQSIR